MNNPTEARLIVDRENEAAKQFLSETDYQLFVDFEHASGAIKSLDPLAFTGDSPSMEGVVGKLIDATVDGSGAFNTFVTDWIRSDAFDPDLPFPPSY